MDKPEDSLEGLASQELAVDNSSTHTPGVSFKWQNQTILILPFWDQILCKGSCGGEEIFVQRKGKTLCCRTASEKFAYENTFAASEKLKYFSAYENISAASEKNFADL